MWQQFLGSHDNRILMYCRLGHIDTAAVVTFTLQLTDEILLWFIIWSVVDPVLMTWSPSDCGPKSRL